MATITVFGEFNHIRVSPTTNPDDTYIVAPGDDYSSLPYEVRHVCKEYQTPEIVAKFKSWFANVAPHVATYNEKSVE